MLYVNFIASLNGLLLLFIIYMLSTKEKWILLMKHSKVILCGIVCECFQKITTICFEGSYQERVQIKLRME